MDSVNISVKKAVAVAETRGAELRTFDEISAILLLRGGEIERHEKANILSHMLSGIIGIEYINAEVDDGYVFIVTANGY